VEQKDGAAARLTVTLQNDAGQYLHVNALRPNARLRLSLGYAGAGTVYTHVCYVEEWTFVRTADESSVVVVAGDARSWLARQSRGTLLYTNQTLDWLAREVLARAGLLTVTLPATSQFSQVVPAFAIPGGATWLMALERLARLYGYDVAARAQPDGTDALLVVEKTPADAAVWSYGEELDELEVGHGGDRANHILVYGAPGSPAIVGEAWDFGDAGGVGQERYLHVVEPLIATRAGAAIRAALELNVEKRRALGGRLVGALHPGYCCFHDPAMAEARARARQVGGINHRNMRRLKEAIPLDAMPDNLREVLNHLIGALDETYDGQLEPQIARAMATLSGAIVRLYEFGELAVRVQALEERDEADDASPRTRP